MPTILYRRIRSTTPVLSLGTGTFGGGTEFFKSWGATDAAGAKRLVDLCLEAGLNFFDSADIYSNGLSEEVLGKVIAGRRERVLLSTKGTFRSGPGANDVGSSRQHLIAAVDGSLRRLGTDHIDLYQLHGFDAQTPIEETLGVLADLVRAGKIRYVGCSNFSGWHLMKSLAIAERYGLPRYVAHQAYYSLVGRDYEWELMPLALAERVGAVVWSPLGWGRLTGKLRRGSALPATSRLNSKLLMDAGPQIDDEYSYRVVDAIDAVAKETGKTVPQIALNWLLQRPSVANVIIGARNEEQLRQNLGAVGWQLDAVHIAQLDAASAVPKPYPYWHQAQFDPDIPAGLTAKWLAGRQAKSLSEARAKALAANPDLPQQEYQEAREAMLGKDFATTPDGAPCIPCMANALLRGAPSGSTSSTRASTAARSTPTPPHACAATWTRWRTPAWPRRST